MALHFNLSRTPASNKSGENLPSRGSPRFSLQHRNSAAGMCALYEGLGRRQHAAGNMGFIVIIPIAALAAWSIFAIFRWLRRGDFGAKWLRTYAMLATAGLALGIWFAFF